MGVWLGPDGFGNTPEEEKARTDMLVKLCRDYHFHLFKVDAVCGQLRTEIGQTTYGLSISQYVTPFGTINMVHNPLFVQDYAGYAFLLDMECFKYRYMNNRDTKLFTNVQAPDVDGEIDQYVTECGLQRMQAPRCALLKGVSI